MGVMTPDLFQFGGRTIEGLIGSSYFEPDGSAERYVSFKSRYAAAYGRESDLAACQGYDAMACLMKAMRSARSLDGPGIRESLRALGSFEALQGERKLDEYGDAVQQPRLYVAKSGRFVRLGEN